MKAIITQRLKRFLGIAVIGVVVIAAVADVVHDFIVNDPVHYFAAQPKRLLLVAAIAIVGGSFALLFERLTPKKKQNLMLFALASIAIGLTTCSGRFLLLLARLLPVFNVFETRNVVFGVCFVALCSAVGATMFWFEFVRAFKKRTS